MMRSKAQFIVPALLLLAGPVQAQEASPTPPPSASPPSAEAAAPMAPAAVPPVAPAVATPPIAPTPATTTVMTVDAAAPGGLAAPPAGKGMIVFYRSSFSGAMMPCSVNEGGALVSRLSNGA